MSVWINIDDETLAVLDASAKFRSLSRADMLREAINEAAAYNEYIREKIAAGARELEKGFFCHGNAQEKH